jgi:hypothetical protein
VHEVSVEDSTESIVLPHEGNLEVISLSYGKDDIPIRCSRKVLRE